MGKYKYFENVEKMHILQKPHVNFVEVNIFVWMVFFSKEMILYQYA